MKKFNQHKNQDGFSLVEVLATIIIIAIISFLLFNIISNGKNQYKKQVDKNQELSTISYKLKVFTKEVRKANEIEYISGNTIHLKIDEENPTTPNIIAYNYDSAKKILYKNNEIFLTNVENFDITPSNENGNLANEIVLKIKNNKLRKPISSKIIVRSGE